MWEDEIAEAYKALSEKHQRFLLAYLRTGNAAEAYRKVYNPLASPHLASVCGNSVLSSAGMERILQCFVQQRTADLLLVKKTFREMAEASKPNWIQDPVTKDWENTGDEPDWKARKDGADGLARLDALYAPVETHLKAQIQSQVLIVELPAKDPVP